MKMDHRARTLMLAGSMVATMGLASCGSDDEATVEPASAPAATQAPATETVVVTQAPPEAAPETEEPAPTEESTEEPTEEEGASEVGVPEGGTAPGTELKVGEAATVNHKSGGEPGLINVTVTSIDKGKASDLDDLDLGDQAAGLIPYYVNIEVEGADETAKNLEFGSMIGAIDGLLGDGSKAQDLSIIGDFAPCDEENLGEFSEGVKIETCYSYVAGGDSEVTGAQFSPYDGPYDSLDGKPIVWTQ